MTIKINRKLLPVKAHFFFFFAALGPILPQMNVYGRQLGVSAEVMGFVTAGLPLLWAAAKPAFGYVVDYWPNHRKFVFMILIATMTGSYCGLWFIPASEYPQKETTTDAPILEYVYQMNDTVHLQNYEETESDFLEKFKCHWSCSTNSPFEVYITNSTYISTIYIDKVENASCSLLHMNFDSNREGKIICTPRENCNLLCYEDESLLNTTLNRNKRALDNKGNDNYVKLTDERFADDVTDDRSKDKSTDKTKVTDLNTTGSSVKIKDSIDNSGDNVSSASSVVNKDNNTTALAPKSVVTYDKNNDNDVTNKIGTGKEVKTENSDKNLTPKDHSIKSLDISKQTLNAKDIRAKVSKVTPSTINEVDGNSFYMTSAFWSFVILMCIGTVAFNVANCIGDAVCFDVLGPENGSKYGAQRAWGTAGYGVTALLGGWLVDAVSNGEVKDFTPAFVLAIAATSVDLFSCRKLKLPSLTSPDDSGAALCQVLKIPRVIVFIIFAVVAGVFDSFIIYYMFWFLEDLADQTGHKDKIKLIEGIVVAGQSFIGEILFFALSGRIIKRWGYGATMTLSLFCYGVRMALISLIQNPWQLIPIEAVMQGPTYALCYSTIVGYAAHVAPEGYSATVQGIVAGMDDGVGFALGSLIGGQLYGWVGGRGSFRILAVTAGIGTLLHALLFALVTRSNPQPPPSEPPEEGEKMLPIENIKNISSDIYRETVVPLTEKSSS